MIYALYYMYIRRHRMQVARWGNSLAIRLPVTLTKKLGLKAGDKVEVVPGHSTTGTGKLEVARKPARKEILQGLRKYRGLVSAGYRFKRDDAYED